MLTDSKYIKLLSMTPVFICDSMIIKQKLNDITTILKNKYPKFKIAFSFKTNYLFAQSNNLRDYKLLAEVVSKKEYLMAKKNNIKDSNIIFNGPNKQIDAQEFITNGGTLNIDNFSELNSLFKKKVFGRVGIRVNFKIKGHAKSRFGFNVDNGEAYKAIELMKNNGMKVETIHCHLGTNINSLFAYKSMSINAAHLINKLISNYDININQLDLGGGFPSNAPLPSTYFGKPLEIKSIISEITANLNKFLNQGSKPTLIFEPGRYLIDDAVYFFTRIIDVKLENGHQQITTDSTINMIPSVWYRPQKIRKFSKNSKSMNTYLNTKIFGSSCQENDILYSGRFTPCQINDILVFYFMGAYNSNLAPDFIFEKPKEIIV